MSNVLCNLSLSFLLFTDKMFNQLQFPTNLNITTDVGFGVDAPVIGKYVSYVLHFKVWLTRHSKNYFFLPKHICSILCRILVLFIIHMLKDVKIKTEFLFVICKKALITKLNTSVYLGGVPVGVHHAHMVCICICFNIWYFN